MPSHTTRARPARPADTRVPAITTDPGIVSAFLEDAAHSPGGRATGVTRPRTEAEVAALLARPGTRLLAVGAQSSLTGGATPMGDLVLSTDRLERVLDVGPSEVTVEAGVPLRQLQSTLDERNAFYPPVPTFDGATAGGVVSTNAAGAATFKYGTTRSWVRGLTVVLADATVLDIRRGEVVADAAGYFEIQSERRSYRVPIPTYQMPDVPKCSAGYYAKPGMDLIDLFIGSEGTLGVVTEITFEIVPRRPPRCVLWVPVPDEPGALGLVSTLRDEARRTWSTQDPRGIDVAAIEHLDRRSLEIVREDGADRDNHVTIPEHVDVGLLVQLETPAGSDAQGAYDEIATALSPEAPDTPLTRTCRVLATAGVLDDAEIALPGDRRRQTQLLALREAVPDGVNRRIAEAKRADARIHKTAGDMIVPFDRFEEGLTLFRSAFARQRLDYAIWGHISDGNVHPNVIAHTADDVRRGQDALLECGQGVIELGGSPLAEHGVGRSPVKQALVRALYGDDGVAQMRRVKAALDPTGRLAPGVLFPTAVRE